MARVLVLDGHSAAALSFVRSLGRAGYWVAVGSNRGIFAAASLSRYCEASFKYPVSTEDIAAFANSVREFVQKNNIELVIPVTDWTTIPIARYPEYFRGLCHFALSTPESLEFVSDKYRVVELGRSLGIPVPETWLIVSAADLRALPELGFPIVVKDRFSVRWVDGRPVFGSVEYAYTRQSVMEKAERRLREAGDVLIQNFVAGVGVGFSCFSVNDEIRLPFQWQRIREVDPRGSGSSSRKSVPLDSETLAQSTALIKSAKFRGISMVEYKKETKTGRSVLMEINGRPWGSIQLAVASGIDYPRFVAEWYLSGKLPPDKLPYKSITCRRMVGELTHLEHLHNGPPKGWPIPYPNLWTSLMKIAVPWYPGMRFDDVSLSDPRPGAAEISNWFQRRLKKK